VKFHIAVACLALPLVLGGCEEKLKPAVSPGLVGRDVPDQESWNATITFSDSGKIKGILQAGHIEVFEGKKITLLDSNIVVDFYDEFERHTSRLNARRGMVDDATRNFEAHDHVVVVSDSGTTLKTDELYWDNRTQKIHTSAFVDITSPKEHIQGQGLESDQSLKEYKISRVTGQAKTNG